MQAGSVCAGPSGGAGFLFHRQGDTLKDRDVVCCAFLSVRSGSEWGGDWQSSTEAGVSQVGMSAGAEVAEAGGGTRGIGTGW